MWLVGSKPIRSFVTRQKHLFRAFCVIANSWGWESILRTTDVMCRALWRHLQSLPYQFSIFEYFGGWQAWMYTKPWKDKGVTHNKLTLLYLYINRWSEGFAIAVCVSFAFTLPPLSAYTKGAVTRDDSQRWFFAQHSTAMLEECWNHSKQCRNNVAMLNRRCESSRVLITLKRRASTRFTSSGCACLKISRLGVLCRKSTKSRNIYQN